CPAAPANVCTAVFSETQGCSVIASPSVLRRQFLGFKQEWPDRGCDSIRVLDAHKMASLDHLELYVAHDFRFCLNHFGCPVRIVFSRECQNRAGDVSKLLARLGADKHAVCGGIAVWVAAEPAGLNFASITVVRPQMIRKSVREDVAENRPHAFLI